jgi:nicotinamide-nucleotide adenylyltransferase
MDERDEILACIGNEDIKYLQSGQLSKYIFPMNRSEAHLKKVSHLIVRFFVMAITPENEIKYLVQKRGKNKRGYPEYFTDSASGHVVYKEKLTLKDIKENAIRELEEEFGISDKRVKNALFYDLHTEENSYTPEIAYIFFGLVDHDVELHPNPVELEVNGSQFYTNDELKKLMNFENVVSDSQEIWEYLLKQDIKNLFEKKAITKEEKSKISLFIGRFQPFHNGHLFVIKEMLKKCEKVKIGIGSSQLSHTINDPFSSEERKQFIISTLEFERIPKAMYEIFEINDIFNAQKWVNHVIGIVGEVDIIFSNSDWVRTLFNNKSFEVADKLPLKMDRLNATRIRNLICDNDTEWLDLVPQEVAKLIQKFNGIQRIKLLKKS